MCLRARPDPNDWRRSWHVTRQQSLRRRPRYHQGLLADLYRAGGGEDESFTAQIIVSDWDIAQDIPRVQNLWVQGLR